VSELEQRPEIELFGEKRRMLMTMGVLADLEEGGYADVRGLLDEITAGGKTAPLLYLAWVLLREGAEPGQKDISIDDLRRLPPVMRVPLVLACVAAMREGFRMESGNEGTRDPVLEEIEKKDEPDA